MPADAGNKLTCTVTASNPAGSDSATSPPVTAGPDPTVRVPVTTQLPHPHKRRAVDVRIVVSWTWNNAWTRLVRIRFLGLPRHATIKVTCRGQGCPPPRAHAANSRHVASLRSALAGTRYRAGDLIVIAISVRGFSTERVRILIRNGRLPKAKLL